MPSLVSTEWRRPSGSCHIRDMAAQELHHEILGEIRLQRRAGCKRISIRVSRTGMVTVTYPWYVLRSRALAFAESKADWIIATRQRVLQATAQPTIESGYRTRFHTVRIEHGSSRSLQIGKEDVVITLKSGEEIECDGDSQKGRRLY